MIPKEIKELYDDINKLDIIDFNDFNDIAKDVDFYVFSDEITSCIDTYNIERISILLNALRYYKGDV